MNSLWFLGVVGFIGSAAAGQNFGSDTGRRSPNIRKRSPNSGNFARKGPIALLFGARDELHNNAVVPRELIRAKRPADRAPVKTVGKTRAKI